MWWTVPLLPWVLGPPAAVFFLGPALSSPAVHTIHHGAGSPNMAFPHCTRRELCQLRFYRVRILLREAYLNPPPLTVVAAQLGLAVALSLASRVHRQALGQLGEDGIVGGARASRKDKGARQFFESGGHCCRWLQYDGTESWLCRRVLVMVMVQADLVSESAPTSKSRKRTSRSRASRAASTTA